jgi:hypothetical protein
MSPKESWEEKGPSEWGKLYAQIAKAQEVLRRRDLAKAIWFGTSFQPPRTQTITDL